MLGKFRSVGEITLDLNHLREQERLKRIDPKDQRQPHILIEYTVVVRIMDRNLVWHIEMNNKNEELDQGRVSLSLVPAFKPGTY